LVEKPYGNQNSVKNLGKAPFSIVKVNDKGTVCLKMGKVTDTVNIITLKPFND
jgi:hypothetical protein